MSDSTNEREQTAPSTGADEKKRENKRIPRPPFYANEYIDMAEALELIMDSFGELILALMTYIIDGTVPDNLPQEVKPIFHIYRKKVDLANKKYDMVCEKNAKNGAKGGRPRKKATAPPVDELPPSVPEPAKKSKTAPKIKLPPTQEQFTKLIEAEIDAGTVSDKCDPAEFFEWANTLKWKVNGEPAQNVGDFLTYATARHASKEITDKVPAELHYLISNAYGRIFKKFHGLRDDEGNTQALTAAINFLSMYDNGWDIHGKTYSAEDWLSALDAFMQIGRAHV